MVGTILLIVMIGFCVSILLFILIPAVLRREVPLLPIFSHYISLVYNDIPELIWEGFFVNNVTLNKLFVLYYLLPFYQIVLMHLIAFHDVFLFFSS